jgi:mercuric ion transport protein
MINGLLAGGGLVAALGASTCCVLPLTLGTLGAGGAWLATLGALAPYATTFQVAAIVMLGAGFWLAYLPRPVVVDGAACAPAQIRRMTKAMLWAGAVIVAAALTARWWEPLTA